jgi:protein-S-isoprenylcysteine O-methyltransferase Ste14
MMLSTGFIGMLLVCAAFGGLHSWLASYQAKRLVERRLGAFAPRSYRLMYNAIGLLTSFALLLFLGIFPDLLIYRIPYPWVLLSMLAQLLAGVGLLLAVRQTGVWSFLGIRQLITPPPSAVVQPGTLTTGGFYGLMRHPIYFFSLFLLWLFPAMTWNTLGLSIGLTVYIFVGASLEERRLRQEFGGVYEEYARSTPMILPRLIPKK